MKHIKIKSWVKILFFLIITFILIYYYSSHIETKFFKVKEYSIINSKIPNNFYGFKIVHISDIHYKNTTDKEDLKKIIEKINKLKPDVVIFSGDLFDKNIEYTKEDYGDLKKLLNKIDYRIGKYAIKGDNDDNTNWLDIINSSDFIDLNDNYDLIYSNDVEPILIIGIGSNYKDNHIKKTIKDIYSKTNIEYNYSILVLHEPDFINYIDYSKFNLILAGHSLNGQIKLPYIGGLIKNKYSKIYYDECYKLGKTKMYISGGIGTGKYKFRLFNYPSINLYRLRNK